MTEENSFGFHHPRAIDKGIAPLDHPQRAPNDLPPPIRGDAPISDRPHDAGFRQPVKIAPSGARPANDMPPGLLPARGCLNPEPHHYGGDPKAPNTYGNVPVEKRR
jgi:hypothetical protein